MSSRLFETKFYKRGPESIEDMRVLFSRVDAKRIQKYTEEERKEALIWLQEAKRKIDNIFVETENLLK